MAVQVYLSLIWSENPEDRSSHDVAQIAQAKLQEDSALPADDHQAILNKVNKKSRLKRKDDEQ